MFENFGKLESLEHFLYVLIVLLLIEMQFLCKTNKTAITNTIDIYIIALQIAFRECS